MEPKTMVTVRDIKKRKKTIKKVKVKLKFSKPLLKKRRLKKKPKIRILKIRKPKIKRQKAKALQFIGEITHFFPKVSVGVLTISRGELKVGDRIRVEGYSTNFRQRVNSMQINHVPIEIAKKGDEIGLEVSRRVRQKDKVYKIV